jgi:hypothetical protein
LEPSAGTALIGGYDITKDMDAIYSLMGVCPQHDLLWETLTGGRHNTRPSTVQVPWILYVHDVQEERCVELWKCSCYNLCRYADAHVSAAAVCCAAGREHLLFYGRLKGLTGVPEGRCWQLPTALCMCLPTPLCCAVLVKQLLVVCVMYVAHCCKLISHSFTALALARQ